MAGPGGRAREKLRRRLHRLNGLQARMALIAGGVLVPAIAYSVWQIASAYGEHTARLSETLRSTAELVSGYETDFIQRTRGMLERLGQDPAIRFPEASGCTAKLQPLADQSVEYSALALLDADGNIVCSSRPDLAGIGRDEDQWFKRLQLGGLDFTVSSLLTSRATGQRTLIAAEALRDEKTGAFAGAVAAAINLQTLNPGSRRVSLPDDGVLLIIDENDVPVVAHADEAALRAMPGPLRLHGGSGSFVAIGDDGVRRAYATSDIGWGRLRVLIGVPTGGSFSWLREEIVVGVFVPTLILVAALAAIWVATNRLVNRHIRLLARAARVYSRGDLSARPVLDRAPTELAELGRVFALMADRVAEREGQLKASLAQKEGLIREIHHRVKNNLQIVASLLNLRLRAVRDPEVRRALEEVQTRIKALALVHRSLYEQDDFGSIDLQRFLAELAQLLIDGADASVAAVELEVRVAPTRVPTEKAMAIALLVTECVSDALQHAFPGGRAGTISVTLDNDGSRARLTIADDGVGTGMYGSADSTDIRSETHSVTLSRLLAKQIGGELRIAGPPGTEISVSFAVDPLA